MKPRLGQGPTSSYTNILHQSWAQTGTVRRHTTRPVTVPPRHTAHMMGHVTITQTARQWCPLSLTFHVPTHSGLGSPTWPCGQQPTRHNQTHCHTPSPRRIGPTHPGTPPRSRLSHAQRVPGPWDKFWLHPGIHTPGRWTSLSPGHSLVTHPAHLPAAREGNLQAQHLPGAHCSSPAPPPRTLFPGWPGLVGTRQLRSSASCGSRTGGSGSPAPLPGLCGQPGLGGKSWGEPGFRLEPQLPIRSPWGRKQVRGRPAEAFLPPPPDRPGTGVSGREREKREGSRE